MEDSQAEWKYQVRFTASEALAVALRDAPVAQAYPELEAVLRQNGGTIQCQYDAFAGYVSEAEREGIDAYPLYAWTRATIENPDKKRKYLSAFTVYVAGEEVYEKKSADALHAALTVLAQGGKISHVVTYDSNPSNNPQPPSQLAR